MIYGVISLMAAFVLYKFIRFMVNKKHAWSVDKIDAELVRTINKQGAKHG